MILPRRLMTFSDKAGHLFFCEADDVRQDMNYRPKGYHIPDSEAERIGLKAYLDQTGWGEVAGHEAPPVEMPAPEVKAVAQAEVEDKAVDGPGEAPVMEVTAPVEEKSEPGPGLHLDTETRRAGRGRS